MKGLHKEWFKRDQIQGMVRRQIKPIPRFTLQNLMPHFKVRIIRNNSETIFLKCNISKSIFWIILIVGPEAKIYELIVRHFLACCSKDAEGRETTVEIEIAEERVSPNNDKPTE